MTTRTFTDPTGDDTTIRSAQYGLVDRFVIQTRPGGDNLHASKDAVPMARAILEAAGVEAVVVENARQEGDAIIFHSTPTKPMPAFVHRAGSQARATEVISPTFDGVFWRAGASKIPAHVSPDLLDDQATKDERKAAEKRAIAGAMRVLAQEEAAEDRSTGAEALRRAANYGITIVAAYCLYDAGVRAPEGA